MAAEMSADQKTEPATLQVGGEEVKVDMPETREIDIHDRDPTHMNDHVKVAFSDIIGEPDEEIYSFDKVWDLSQKAFNGSRKWCYRITSVICALPCAVCWGLYFACLSFCTVWACVPCIKCYSIKMDCMRNLCRICAVTCLEPCYEAMSKLCFNIRVTLKKE